jgi:hypothetical protein
VQSEGRLARKFAPKQSEPYRQKRRDCRGPNGRYTHTHGSGKFGNKDARLVSALAGEPLIEAAPATELVFRVFVGPTVIVTGKSPILNVKEQKTYDFRWVCVYVNWEDGSQLAVSQATRLS